VLIDSSLRRAIAAMCGANTGVYVGIVAGATVFVGRRAER
jgi:hypothetical protein